MGAPLGLVGYSLAGGSLDLFLMQVLFTTAITALVLGLMQVITSGLKLPDWGVMALSIASAIFFSVLFTNDLINSPVMNWLCILFGALKLFNERCEVPMDHSIT